MEATSRANANFWKSKKREKEDEADRPVETSRSLYGHFKTVVQKETALEATLFWIGCGLGAYGVVLRQIFKREAWVQKRIISVLLHLLLWERWALWWICVQRFDRSAWSFAAMAYFWSPGGTACRRRADAME